MTKCAQCGNDVDIPGYEGQEFGRCSNCDPVEASKKKRANNREWSANFLESRGVYFETKNSGAHLIVKYKGITADFWPGTGKWIDRAIGIYSRGVRKLIKHLEIQTRITCQCSGEAFTDRLVGDETITTCDDCGREKLDGK